MALFLRNMLNIKAVMMARTVRISILGIGYLMEQ
jgi:hypothetical protein